MPGEWALRIAIDGNEVDASAVECLRLPVQRGHSGSPER
jgi:hypothetical protein